MSLLGPQLEAFLAIVQHKTVHGAANTLYVTQTAVTQRIRALESKLQTTLFIRTRRGMFLTPEGEALLHYCQAVRDIEGETLAKITGVATQTEIQINITGPSSMMRSRVVAQCLPVMQEFPNLLIQFAINDTENRHLSLRNNASQLAIIQKEQVAREMESKILKPERYVLVCSQRWKNRKLHDIIQNERIIDFDPADQMTFNYLKHYHLLDKARHDRHFANRTELLAMLIAAGCGYGVLTTEFSKPYLEDKQLIILNSNKIYEYTLALAWYARPEPPRYFTALIKAIC